MKTIFRLIPLNAQNFYVTLLHKALAALGFVVSSKEVSQAKAGKDTLKQVRALQAKLNVAIDDSTLLDEATARAIASEMTDRGLTLASRSFNVKGSVKSAKGSIKKRQRLIAFDLDLRGVAVYRTLKTLAGIQKVGGFEYLGEAISDNQGDYGVAFYDWQYGLAERKKADVVVYALSGEKEEIIGHSRLVNTEEYSDGLIRNVDVVVAKEDDRTEYTILMSALESFLKESHASLAEIATSSDQLNFTAAELDIALSHIVIAARAELLAAEEKKLSHELLYALGRQAIRLNWKALYKKQEEELHQALTRAMDERIISTSSSREMNSFIGEIKRCAIKHILDDKEQDSDRSNPLNAMLSISLQKKAERVSFLKALGEFKESDFGEFWNKHLLEQPEFKDKPELVSGLQFTQQLIVLTDNHQPLIKLLQVNNKIKSAQELLELSKKQWIEIIKKSGVSDSIDDKDDDAKIDRYVERLQSRLNASFPTKRIAKMVANNQLAIKKTEIEKSVGRFLADNEQFDFTSSRIDAFDKQIVAASAGDPDEVKAELKKFQRVFQFCDSPESMTVMLQNNLHSAYSITNIPRRIFIKRYGNVLGGEKTAAAIHQRASHISTRAEMNAMHLKQYDENGAMPMSVVSARGLSVANNTLREKLPNYENLFGSPDLCDCQHCRSVFSPAAYFVELLQFLWRGGSDSSAKTPLELLEARRPDLLHLPLSCENTNTLIPYVDLVNEVMESYAAKGSLDTFEGYDTGDATVDELRANPQHYNLGAYTKLSEAKYPFTLPFHQPLHEIRTYSDHLKVSRYNVFKAMNPLPDVTSQRAIEAESLKLSQEEYILLTGEAFTGPLSTTDVTELHEIYGYNTPAELEALSHVREFMKRTGLAYTDLVELVNTRFINPHQVTLDFFQKIFSHKTIDANTIYTQLKEIKETAAFNPANNADIVNAITFAGLTSEFFVEWVVTHFGEFQQVITLFEPKSKCSLDTTRLRTIQNIYEDPDVVEISPTEDPVVKLGASGITDDSWTKVHRFIRLWRKTGWSIHETDLILSSLGETDITSNTISKLESVFLLKSATKQQLIQLAVLWGNIDTYGNNSLYKKLFLNKAVQQIDEAFTADDSGNYLQKSSQNPPAKLAEHQSAILAAFRISEEELAAITDIAHVIDEQGNHHAFNIAEDLLNIENLSAIYRHVVLAKSLKLSVTDLCTLIALFESTPFSSPEDTYQFYQLAASTKTAKFKPAMLEYIFTGALQLDSRIGLDKEKVRQAAKDIRDNFSTIEQEHPQKPALPLTSEIVAAKLSISFQPEIVSRFIEIIEGTALFESDLDGNLNVTIPEALAGKYLYIKGSSRFRCVGIMSDSEKIQLNNDNSNISNFSDAVEILYAAPEVFINGNFSGVFDNPAGVNGKILDRPAQNPPVHHDEKLTYIYQLFLPLLKSKLQQDAVPRNIANLIGLSEEATTLLIGHDMEAMVNDLSNQGFSATYYNNTDWSPPVALERRDSTIDFSWEGGSPDSDAVIANDFSVRWKAYIAAPASGEYTLVVDVKEADEVFNLYLDGALILDKSTGNETTSFEWIANLNAAYLHLLTLEYAESTGSAGIRLRWKTATSALEVIPATVAYPADFIDRFEAKVSDYHRAATFILGFKISDTELDHFLTYRMNFGNLDFTKLTPDHWQRIHAYSTLRNAVPQAQTLLTEVFSLANRLHPLPTVEQLIEKISQATNWDRLSLALLLSKFSLSVGDFTNEIALSRLSSIMAIISKSGLSAETVAKWGAVQTDFNELHETAQLLKNTVKAKYDDPDWLALAGNLSDKIRAHQQQALISYLLVQPAILEADIVDADGLYEYFLIDVQMGTCMDTSRIVQASAAVQLFVNRILLNLEKDVSPEAIDRDRWEWLKKYRLWEANKKVFLYPENWLEPEWRKDRSEFFKDLESHLVQNDITARSVEKGLRNYLMSLDEVANLDVCGMHQENDIEGKLKYLHVFGRTHNLPYKYFYRRWNQYGKWSAWEKVQVDIQGVEDGANSGVHLIPVVWKGRLILFWPEFREISKAPKLKGNMIKAAEEPISDLTPQKYWEIRLAWSEKVDGAWSPKQVSKEFIPLERYLDVYEEQNLRFIADIDHQDKLTIATHIQYEGAWLELWAFVLPDITSKIGVRWFEFIADYRMEGIHQNGWKEYEIYFMNIVKDSNVEFLDEVYLTASVAHRLFLTPIRENYYPILNEPLFISDTYRTYFVRPLDITLRDWIKDPKINPPLYMKMPAEGKPPNDKPHLRPSDSRPGVSMGLVERTAQRMGYVGAALSGGYGDQNSNFLTQRPGKSLEFHTFYHPFSNEYVTRLNQNGIKDLMLRNTEGSQDDTAIVTKFEDIYLPNFNKGLVKKHTAFSTSSIPRTAYKENICFDIYGANSLYNWELFFHAPLYIATRLSKNGKYEEAMKWFHYIFDPTTDEEPEIGNETSRYWKLLPFKDTAEKSLEAWLRGLTPNNDPNNPGNDVINEWRDHPFDSHLVASNRPIAYMKHVVIKYVENLIAWGDSLFRQFTRESVYEAIQMYVIASHVLGPRSELVPKRGEIKVETYASLKDTLDDFSNALVELENIFPYSSEVNVDSSATGTNMLGTGAAFYFCVPGNEKLLEYWDTLADRLFKIRNCQDLDGVVRGLALFAPPIDPGALIQAHSQGLSLGSILADLGSPPPIYRFAFLLQKANEFCSDVKALGSALLSALEKKDAEELSRLRATQEINMLELVTGIRERQVLTAKANSENLLKVRETAKLRFDHYTTLLGNETVTVPVVPSIDPTSTQLPSDTNIPLIETDVDISLVDSDESGVKLISREMEQLSKNEKVKFINATLSGTETLAGLVYAFPKINGFAAPMGVGTEVDSPKIATATHMLASAARGYSSYLSAEASQASVMAGYIRRTHDWTLQANLAAREIIQIDKQITSADIQIQLAEKELENHKKQIENSKQVELFIRDKFTNQELYQWMKEQLYSVYKQSYNLAYEMAKSAEQAYRYELGTDTASFIHYGYWDNSKQGLVSGEKLQLALRQMDKSFLDSNRRELELSKSISVALHNPLALIELRETGKCYLSLPEELFDLDFQGHYFRRIKSVSLSIPCVTGPYTTVNCSLRLLKNAMRFNTSMNSNEEYEHENEDGLLIDDDRFRASNVPVTSIATSRGQNDAGMFEFNFRDERYLPFEGAGVISDWQLELSTEKEFRQFDYATISDVILHLNFTAKESGGLFKQGAVNYMKKYLDEQPLMRMLSMKQEFSSSWNKFLHPLGTDDHQMTISLSKQHFPFLFKDKNIEIQNVIVFVKLRNVSLLENNGFALTISHDGGTERGLLKDESNDELSGLAHSLYTELSGDITQTGKWAFTMPETDVEILPGELKQTVNINGGSIQRINTDEVEDIGVLLQYEIS